MVRFAIAAAATLAALAVARTAIASDWADACDLDDPSACLYSSGDAGYRARADELLDLDEESTGRWLRHIDVLVYTPDPLPDAPVPVVLVTGGSGSYAPDQQVPEWAEVLVAAGYRVVAVGTSLRTTEDQALLCEALGVAPGGSDCAGMTLWDRPHDVAAAIDWVEDMADGPWADEVDIDDGVGLLGFSEGASAVLIVAGATREVGETELSIRDPRVAAVVAMSPSGQRAEGFTTDDPWAGVTVPTLLASSEGDNVADDHPLGSRIGMFDEMSGSDQATVYIHDLAARHVSLALRTTECERRLERREDFSERVGPPDDDDLHLDEDPGDRCADHSAWLSAAALALLDGAIGGDARGFDYLASDALDLASDGVVETQYRR